MRDFRRDRKPLVNWQNLAVPRERYVIVPNTQLGRRLTKLGHRVALHASIKNLAFRLFTLVKSQPYSDACL